VIADSRRIFSAILDFADAQKTAARLCDLIRLRKAMILSELTVKGLSK
jgi:hypothetical protein